MLVIKAKANQYVKDNKIVLVYTVASSEKDAAKAAAEIKEYETSQGEYARKNDAGEFLYFSQRVCQVGAQLTKTQKGRFTVLEEDLEVKAAERETAVEMFANQFLGKLKAVGVTPAQYKAQLMASL